MSEPPPLEQEIDTMIGSLRADSRDIRVFFPVFAAKLADTLPESVEVERDLSLFARRRRPIRKITVAVGDDLLEAELTPTGLVCREFRVLSGLSSEIPLDAWLRVLAASLHRRARTAAEANQVLRSLLI